jgi:hypothetical protein
MIQMFDDVTSEHIKLDFSHTSYKKKPEIDSILLYDLKEEKHPVMAILLKQLQEESKLD